jgi:predicted alpha/beta superfamily hydrolase
MPATTTDPSRCRALRASLGAAWPFALAACGAAPQAGPRPEPGVRLRFQLDLRAAIADGRFDPARDRVGERGAVAPLAWHRTLAAAPWPGRPGWYVAEAVLAAAPAQPVAHKFKIDRPGAAPDDGWEPGRNRAAMVTTPETVVERAFGDAPGAPPPQRSGRIERIAPRPSAFVTPREVQVWLPPGYGAEPALRHPVLLMHDGQNLFDHLAAGAEWQLDEAAEAGVRSGTLAPFIIVAVASTGTRMHDYTPVPMQLDGREQGGGAAAYGRYLVEELLPLIDARYATHTDAAQRAVGGSSLGGLVSLWLLLHRRAHFGAGLVVSPSVWWGGGHILGEVDRRARGPAPRIWLDIGQAEGAGAVRDVRRLRDALATAGWPAAVYQEAPGDGHDEAAWARRVPAMLRFLHGRG